MKLRSIIFFISFIFFFLMTLSSCGQSGPLYLEKAEPQKTKTSTH